MGVIGWLAARALPGALALAVAAGAWGGVQSLRTAHLRAELAVARANLRAAQVEIVRLNAEAAIRQKVDDAVDNIERLAPDGVADWLRERAGRH